MEKPEELKKLTVEIPKTLWKRVKARALEEERDMRLIVIETLEAYLRGAKKGGKRAK